MLIGFFVLNAKCTLKGSKTVEQNTKWNYGIKPTFFGKTVYSKTNNDTKSHSTTVVIGENTKTSSKVAPKIEAYVELSGMKWNTAYCYYNVF